MCVGKRSIGWPVLSLFSRKIPALSHVYHSISIPLSCRPGDRFNHDRVDRAGSEKSETVVPCRSFAPMGGSGQNGFIAFALPRPALHQTAQRPVVFGDVAALAAFPFSRSPLLERLHAGPPHQVFGGGRKTGAVIPRRHSGPSDQTGSRKAANGNAPSARCAVVGNRWYTCGAAQLCLS